MFKRFLINDIMNIKNNAINMNINNDQNYKKTGNNITENKLTTL